MTLPELLGPRYWPTWLGLAWLRICESLPYPWLLLTGRLVGAFARRLPLGFVNVARRNIALCLPELSSAEQRRLLEEHFRSLGIGLCESAMTWWSSDERIRKLSRIEGLEHLEQALRRGQGVILLTAHFTTLEIGARIMNATIPIHVLYRPPKNALLAEVAGRNRGRRAGGAILHDDIRAVVKALKRNEIVWYAPDQSYRKKGARMVPFFGIPTATNTFTPRLAKMTGATVLYFTHERLPRSEGYRVVIHPALEGFPSEDPIADTERYNHFIEGQVRRVPEQYWWIHRRFKGLTPDYPDYYAK
jgi:KDO2-lipid IV(A) lauroyltransferase